MTLRKANLAYAARSKYAALLIGFADFAGLAATNGLAATINLGTQLPVGAVIDSAALIVTAYFTGGGASAVTLSVGATGITTDLVNAHNIFGTTTLNKWLPPTAGTQAVGPAFSGLQLIATVTPDGGHQLKLLTAGACQIQVYYSVPDQVTAP